MIPQSINNDPTIRLAELVIPTGADTSEPLALSISTAGSFANKPYCVRLVQHTNVTGTITLLAGSAPEALTEVTKDGSPIEITPGEVLEPITTWGLPFIALKASEAQSEQRTIHLILAQL